MIAHIRVLSSTDGTNWQTIGDAEFGNLVNDPTPRRFDFSEAVTARFLRFEILETEGNSPVAAVAEIYIF